jgi:hypothetical protein
MFERCSLEREYVRNIGLLKECVECNDNSYIFPLVHSMLPPSPGRLRRSPSYLARHHSWDLPSNPLPSRASSNSISWIRKYHIVQVLAESRQEGASGLNTPYCKLDSDYSLYYVSQSTIMASAHTFGRVLLSRREEQCDASDAAS